MARLEARVTHSMADLLDYQEDGVVSRVLVKTAKGNVTLMAFDEGEELSEHSAPFDALVHVVEGEGRVAIAGEWHSVPAGHAILMPADVPHAVKAPQRFKMVLTMLRG